MLFQLNLAAIVAVAGQATWKKAKPVLVRDVVLLPALGFLGVILLWWFTATFLTELMPTPLQALLDSAEYANPFFRKGPGNLGLGWLLLASLRRVLLGFSLGAAVAIPLGFLIGMSRAAMLTLNPLIQVFKPVSPLAWLPIALQSLTWQNLQQFLSSLSPRCGRRLLTQHSAYPAFKKIIWMLPVF
jgi:nitrate/nitrite transport system permease protein